jgi:hypothetical protein
MKMALGISPQPEIQAQLLEAYFHDQCTPRFRQWIHVAPSGAALDLKRQHVVNEDPGDFEGDAVSLHASTIRELRLPNAIVRALTFIARAIPGRPKFRIVVEDLGTFAREELLVQE